ncbi:MAG: SIMPL domain-containing protein [Vulcanimicrobiaceae bacterium]|jgi:uncharacterized protein YggE
MRRIAWTTVAFLALAVPLPVAAATAPPTLTVTGVGVLERAPDRAVVTFDIVTNDDHAAVATSANNTIYAALSAKLAALGITAAELRTLSYSLTFVARPAEPNPAFAQRYGYVVTRRVGVTTDALGSVGALIDAGVAAGATNVEGVSFQLRDERAAQRDALVAAYADADAQAEAVAGAAHLRLARIASIEIGAAAQPIRPLTYMGTAVARSASAVVPTDIQPSSLSVRETVVVVYDLAP